MENETRAIPVIPPSALKGIYLLLTALALGIPRSFLEWPLLQAPAQRLPNGMLILIVSQLFSFAIVGGLLFLVYRRHNWARWCYTLLTLVGIPFSVYPLYLSLNAVPISGMIGIVQNLLQVTALVFLFRPASSAWFKWRAPSIRAVN